MLDSIFYMIRSMAGKENPTRKFARMIRYKMEGERAARKAKRELAELEARRPKYVSTIKQLS